MKRKTLHPKTRAIGVGGAVTTIILGIARRAHVHLTMEEAAALATLVCGAFSWLGPERISEALDGIKS